MPAWCEVHVIDCIAADQVTYGFPSVQTPNRSGCHDRQEAEYEVPLLECSDPCASQPVRAAGRVDGNSVSE